VNESFAPPWFVSSTEEKQPLQARSTSSMFATSVPAAAPLYVTLKPVDAAPVTVTVPAKPGIALIAAVRFALLYGWPDPPITAESLPPTRTLNGEKNVELPPPELASPDTGAMYSKLRGVGTPVIWNVPL
jgi:hypothetical protein